MANKRVTKKIRQQVIELNITIDDLGKIARIVGISVTKVREILGFRD